MPREQISSNGTFYYKLGLPFFWTLGFGIVTFLELSDVSRSSPGDWVMPAAWVLGSAFLWTSGARLKTVWIEGDGFIVSHFRREDTVPFTAVRELSSSRFVKPATIKIALDDSLGLGKSIRFMPPIKLFIFPGQEHPLAVRLRKLIAERTGRAVD